MLKLGYHVNGRDGKRAVLRCRRTKVVVAKGIRDLKVLYGDDGPYVEMEESMLEMKNLKRDEQRAERGGEFYDTWETEGREVKVYEQRKTVGKQHNPPRAGRSHWAEDNNRAGGYADYKVGLFYVSPDEVDMEWEEEGREEKEEAWAKVVGRDRRSRY